MSKFYKAAGSTSMLNAGKDWKTSKRNLSDF